VPLFVQRYGVLYFRISDLLISLIGYLVCKRAYGGLYRIDPEKYPLNPRTGLAKGDVKQISIYIVLCGIAAFVGSVLLYLYEGEWGEEYYLEEYGSGFFSDFYGMLDACRWGGIIMILAGVAALFIARKLERTEATKEA
jgi:hypothetical protein